MSMQDIKAKLAGANFASLIKSTKKTQKQRIISDVEFLDQEQYAFLESHTQQRFFSFMQSYWGEKLIDHEITCKTFNGEVINIDRGSIRVVDKRWKGASHCICGKAIRYEYWIGQYGPIGSIHIVEHTDLDKTFVRDITKGYKTENTLRTEIVRMLADLRDEGNTYEDWIESFNLTERMKHIGNVRNEEKRQLITQLVDLKLPLPEGLRQELRTAERRTNAHVQLQHNVYQPANNPYSALISRGEQALLKYEQRNHVGFSQYHIKTFRDLLEKLKRGDPTDGQLNYYKSLIDRLEVECEQPPASSGHLNAQVIAREVLELIVKNDVANSFARSLLANSQNGNLTIRQLDCIFLSELDKKRKGLYCQYKDLMEQNGIKEVDSVSYQS